MLLEEEKERWRVTCCWCAIDSVTKCKSLEPLCHLISGNPSQNWKHLLPLRGMEAVPWELFVAEFPWPTKTQEIFMFRIKKSRMVQKWLFLLRTNYFWWRWLKRSSFSMHLWEPIGFPSYFGKIEYSSFLQLLNLFVGLGHTKVSCESCNISWHINSCEGKWVSAATAYVEACPSVWLNWKYAVRSAALDLITVVEAQGPRQDLKGREMHWNSRLSIWKLRNFLILNWRLMCHLVFDRFSAASQHSCLT